MVFVQCSERVTDSEAVNSETAREKDADCLAAADAAIYEPASTFFRRNKCMHVFAFTLRSGSRSSGFKTEKLLSCGLSQE